jgi:hypothetical protein
MCAGEFQYFISFDDVIFNIRNLNSVVASLKVLKLNLKSYIQ